MSSRPKAPALSPSAKVEVEAILAEQAAELLAERLRGGNTELQPATAEGAGGGAHIGAQAALSRTTPASGNNPEGSRYAKS
jgi:hypothetical protein